MSRHHHRHHHHRDGRSANRQRRHEARRERRYRRRRMILLGLLAMAVSPSLVALYYSTMKSGQSNHVKENKGDTNNKDMAEVAADLLLKDPFALPELKDPNFGLPQIIVHREHPTKRTVGEKENNAMKCVDSPEGPHCCATWNLNTDSWWMDHFEWELSVQNSTHTCFRKIVNPMRILFLKKLSKLQWQGDCSLQPQKQSSSKSKNNTNRDTSLNSFAVSLSSLAHSFSASYQQGKTFSYDDMSQWKSWDFATKNASHWAYCPAMDPTCYFLPVGASCRSHAQLQNQQQQVHDELSGPSSLVISSRSYKWLRWFAFRPRHILRQQLVQQRQSHQSLLSHARSQCSAVHIPSANPDSTNSRRPMTMKEILDKMKNTIQSGETILVLTDDDAVQRQMKDLQPTLSNALVSTWWQSSDGKEATHKQLGSRLNDPSLDLLSIMSKLELVSTCRQFVFSKNRSASGVTAIAEAIRDGREGIRLVNIEDWQTVDY